MGTARGGGRPRQQSCPMEQELQVLRGGSPGGNQVVFIIFCARVFSSQVCLSARASMFPTQLPTPHPRPSCQGRYLDKGSQVCSTRVSDQLRANSELRGRVALNWSGACPPPVSDKLRSSAAPDPRVCPTPVLVRGWGAGGCAGNTLALAEKQTCDENILAQI